jgi:uncharacterized membrane protein
MRPICATCRDAVGTCPSCRLAERIDAASVGRGELPGDVRGSTAGSAGPSGPNPGYAGGYAGFAGANAQAGTNPKRYHEGSTAVATISPETRALVALGYPFWPLAALALLDPKRSPYIRRQALQALGVSFGFGGLWIALSAIVNIPVLGLSAVPLLPLLIPLYIVATVVYGFKVWRGDDVRVPLLSDWLDQRWPEDANAA